jgi:prolyl-tRNA synthetase
MEQRGVPLRRDRAEGWLTAEWSSCARRRASRARRSCRWPRSARVPQLLTDIQQALYDRALAFREAHTARPATYDEFRQAVSGFALAWCEQRACEAQIKEETRATTRCIRSEQEGGEGVYALRRPAARRAVFGRAY